MVLVPGKEVFRREKLLAVKTIGDWLRETEGFWSPKQLLLQNLFTDLLRFTHSNLQCWASSLPGTHGRNLLIWLQDEGWRGSFLPQRDAVPLLNPSPAGAGGSHL